MDLGAAVEREAQYVGQQIYQELSLEDLNWWVSVRKLPQMELLTAEVYDIHLKSELHKNVAISHKRQHKPCLYFFNYLEIAT